MCISKWCSEGPVIGGGGGVVNVNHTAGSYVNVIRNLNIII